MASVENGEEEEAVGGVEDGEEKAVGRGGRSEGRRLRGAAGKSGDLGRRRTEEGRAVAAAMRGIWAVAAATRGI